MTRLFTIVVGLCLAGCQTSAPAKGDPVPARQAKAQKNHVVIEASAPACQTTAPCSLEISITATADTHVNEEYPHKFKPAAEPAVTWSDAAPLSIKSEKNASWTVPYTTTSSSAPLSGEVAVSVCNDEACFIEKVPVTLAAGE